MMEIKCKNCGLPFPADDFPYRCTRCGGIFNFDRLPEYGGKDPAKQGIWQYQSSFGLFSDSPVITLGEGNTPLVMLDLFDKQIGFKLEYLNPTGSFKDRGTAVLMSALLERGIDAAVEDSSGNAGASFAAYSARAGLKSRIYIPDSTPIAKRRQIEAYGSDVVRVMGPRSNASRIVRDAAEGGQIYASHAYLPHGIIGCTTIAYELFEQLGRVPGAVITPVGQGSLYLGIGYGFQILRNAGIVDRLPVMVGVQSMACAPIWTIFNQGPAGFQWITEGETLADGIRIKNPHRGDDILRLARETGGFFVAVDEDQIRSGLDHLRKQGFFIEPTSAVVWHGLTQVVEDIPEPVVVVLSGSGYKTL